MKRVIFGFITITALAVLGFAPFANAQQGNHNKQSTDIDTVYQLAKAVG